MPFALQKIYATGHWNARVRAYTMLFATVELPNEIMLNQAASLVAWQSGGELNP